MTTLTEIKIENLKAFENNPFIFREDTAFNMLIEIGRFLRAYMSR